MQKVLRYSARVLCARNGSAMCSGLKRLASQKNHGSHHMQLHRACVLPQGRPTAAKLTSCCAQLQPCLTLLCRPFGRHGDSSSYRTESISAVASSSCHTKSISACGATYLMSFMCHCGPRWRQVM